MLGQAYEPPIVSERSVQDSDSRGLTYRLDKLALQAYVVECKLACRDTPSAQQHLIWIGRKEAASLYVDNVKG